MKIWHPIHLRHPVQATIVAAVKLSLSRIGGATSITHATRLLRVMQCNRCCSGKVGDVPRCDCNKQYIDSLIRVTWIIHVGHDSFIYSIRIGIKIYSSTWLIHICSTLPLQQGAQLLQLQQCCLLIPRFIHYIFDSYRYQDTTLLQLQQLCSLLQR